MPVQSGIRTVVDHRGKLLSGRLGCGRAANKRRKGITMLSARGKRLVTVAAGLTAAACMTFAVSASSALAGATSPGVVTASFVKPALPAIRMAQKTREDNGANPCAGPHSKCTIGPAHPTIRHAPPSKCPPGEEYELLPTFPIEIPGCGPPYLNADNWPHTEI